MVVQIRVEVLGIKTVDGLSLVRVDVGVAHVLADHAAILGFHRYDLDIRLVLDVGYPRSSTTVIHRPPANHPTCEPRPSRAESAFLPEFADFLLDAAERCPVTTPFT